MTIPITLTASETATPTSVRTFVPSAAPAAPITATLAYEPMLSATSRKNRPWPVGSPSAGVVRSVTCSGTPCLSVTLVNTAVAATTEVSEFPLATISSGLLASGTKAPTRSRSCSCCSAAARSSTVWTSSAAPAFSWIACARPCAWGVVPTTATLRWCGSGWWKAPW